MFEPVVSMTAFIIGIPSLFTILAITGAVLEHKNSPSDAATSDRRINKHSYSNYNTFRKGA